MRIAVDAMGGDNAPYEIVVGALDAVKSNPDITVVLVGKEDEINKIIDEKTKDRSGIEVVNATEVIEFDDVPTKAVRSKKDSSLVVAMKLVKDKQADAFLSAGSTGAILVGGLFIVGRIKGIDRPALTGFFPNPKGKPYSQRTVYDKFRVVLWRCRISHGGCRKGPRVHDLRHTFAVHCLKKWVDDGEQVNALLPVLSSYMGHVNLGSVNKYLRLTADVFPDITRRVEKYFGYIIPNGGHVYEEG